MNVQSFLAHRDEVLVEVFCYQPSIVILSEARCTDDIQEVEIAVDGYVCVR